MSVPRTVVRGLECIDPADCASHVEIGRGLHLHAVRVRNGPGTFGIGVGLVSGVELSMVLSGSSSDTA
jgi:hypothetical protein